MSTIKLYEIAQAREILDAWLEETSGELTPELEALLAELSGAADEKIERVALYVQELLANAKANRAEADRLFGRAATNENAAAALKDYLKRHMEALGKTKVNGLLATVAIQVNSAPAVTTSADHSVLYEMDEAARPFIRREEVVKYSLDREKILATWKANAPLPSAIQVDRGSHLRIR